MKRETKTIALALFILLYAIYLLSYSGWLHIIDEISLFSVTESIAKRAAFDTNQIAWSQLAIPPIARLGASGLLTDVFAKKGVAPSLLAVPFYWLGMLLPQLGNLQAALLLNPVVTAATGALLFLVTMRLGYRKGTGIILALLYGLGTMAWPYAKTFFGEPLSALALLLAVYYLFSNRREGLESPLLAGSFLGLATATIVLNAALAPVFLLYYLLKRQPKDERIKSSVAFLSSLGCFCLGIGLYNMARFGSILETGYQLAQGKGFSNPLEIGVYGLLFSPYKGLFLYVPILVVSLISIPLFLRRHRAEGFLILSVSLVYLYLYARWFMWWGGIAWGPRFLVPLLPLWVLLSAPLIERTTSQRSIWPKVGLCLLGLLSFGIQFLSISVNYGNWEVKLRQDFPRPEIPPVPTAPAWTSQFSLSPLLGQVRLFARWNSDLAWLRARAIDWPALVAGCLLFLLAGFYLLGVLRWGGRGGVRALGLFLPIAVIVVTGFSLSRYYPHPLDGDPQPGYLASLAYIETHHRSGDAIITITPYDYEVPMNRYKGRLPIYGFSLDEPPLEGEAVPLLERILTRHRRLWLITANIPLAHPQNGTERWLVERAYKASDQWFDDFRLGLYATPAEGGAFNKVAYRFGPGIELAGWYLDAGCEGQVLCLSLLWRAQAVPAGDYKVFVHVVDERGQIVAQRDAMPEDGYKATLTWAIGEQIEDHYGVLMPEGAPKGEYKLIVGVYDAVTGARLEVRDEAGRIVGDSVTLNEFSVP